MPVSALRLLQLTAQGVPACRVSVRQLQHLPGVSCAIFPVHKILNLRSFLCVCNDSDSAQLFHLGNFARVLCSNCALPVLSLCSAAERGLMASDLMQTAIIHAQLVCMSNCMPCSAATSTSWVTCCIACTPATATGFHINTVLSKKALLPSWRCCTSVCARCWVCTVCTLSRSTFSIILSYA